MVKPLHAIKLRNTEESDLDYVLGAEHSEENCRFLLPLSIPKIQSDHARASFLIELTVPCPDLLACPSISRPRSSKPVTAPPRPTVIGPVTPARYDVPNYSYAARK